MLINTHSKDQERDTHEQGIVELNRHAAKSTCYFTSCHVMLAKEPGRRACKQQVSHGHYGALL